MIIIKENGLQIGEDSSEGSAQNIDFVYNIAFEYPDGWSVNLYSNYGWFGTRYGQDGTAEAGFCGHIHMIIQLFVTSVSGQHILI